MNFVGPLSIAVLSAAVCAAIFALDLARIFRRTRLRRVYGAILRKDVPESYLMGQEVDTKSPEVQEVLEDLRSSAANLTFRHSYIQYASRLSFDAIDERGAEMVVKTVGSGGATSHARQSLFNEALILSHLSGVRAPHLVSVASTKSHRPYLVRDRVFGVSLDRVLQSRAIDRHPPTFREARDLLISIGQAVTDLHDAQVIHGDIKPANIVATWESGKALDLGKTNALTLIDFESASIVDDVGNSLGGLWRGTPYFMAPERYAQSFMSAVSDVYSCSALASLILTGRPMRPGSQAGRRIPSEELRTAIRRGMSIDPRGRQSSMREWVIDIERAFTKLLDRSADDPVDWPADGNALASELSREAFTISLAQLSDVSYSRVASLVDFPTLTSSLESRLNEVDPSSRRLAELLWTRNVPLDEAAKQLDLPVARAVDLLQALLDSLEEAIRAGSVAKISSQQRTRGEGSSS